MEGSESGANNTTLGYLIQEGMAQEPEVLRALIREYGVAVFRLAFGLVPPDTAREREAVDLTGLAFHQAVRNTRNAHHFDSLHTWLLSELLKVTRRSSGRASAQGAASLEERVQALPNRLRLPLLLHYNQGIPVTDMAALLKTSEAKVRKRMQRAREALLDEPLPKVHRWEELHSLLEIGGPARSTVLEAHLEGCAACLQAERALQALDSELHKALQPLQRPLDPQEKKRIREIVQMGIPENERIRTASLPLKELAWMLAVVVGFLLLFQGLSPLWASNPAVHVRPTAAPASRLEVQIRQTSYENLISILNENPAPVWARAEVLETTDNPTTGIEFSPEGRYAAYGVEEKLILLDLQANIRTHLASQEGVITTLAFSGGDRQLIASGNEHGVLRIWSLEDLAGRYSIDDFPGPVHSLAFAPDGRTLAAGGNRGVWIYEVGVDAIVRVMDLSWDWIRVLAISPDGRSLAAADRDRSIVVWDLESFGFLGRFRTGQHYTTELAFSPNSRRLAVAGFDGTVQVIGLVRSTNDVLSGTLIYTLEHPSWVSDVAWLEDGAYLASSSAVGGAAGVPGTARGVFTWEMSTGLPASLPLVNNDDFGTNRLALTPDGELLTGSFNGSIYRWQNLSGQDSPLSLHYFRRETDLFDNRITGIPSGDFLAITAPSRSDTTILLRPAHPWLQNIPLDYRYYGSSTTSIGSEQYFYVLNRRGEDTAGVAVHIRPLEDLHDQPMIDDYIGARAVIKPVEIGGTFGELVQGEWIEAPIDPDGVFRWMPSGWTRFRWIQDGFLVEVGSQGEVADLESLWQRVIQPIASAVIAGGINQNTLRYLVMDGDTCSSIAARYGTTVAEIEAINGLDDCSLLSIGQELLVRLETDPETIAQTDLNCDGVPEIIQLIPANQSVDDQRLIFGILLKALTSGAVQDSGFYAEVWRYSIVEHDVEYFTEPILFSPPGECQVLIAINGYGGGGREAGLSVFQWTGRRMQPILNSAGALNGGIDTINADGLLTMRTTRLTLNATLSYCVQTDLDYIWQNGRFSLVNQTSIGNIDCLRNAP